MSGWLAQVESSFGCLRNRSLLMRQTQNFLKILDSLMGWVDLPRRIRAFGCLRNRSLLMLDETPNPGFHELGYLRNQIGLFFCMCHQTPNFSSFKRFFWLLGSRRIMISFFFFTNLLSRSSSSLSAPDWILSSSCSGRNIISSQHRIY